MALYMHERLLSTWGVVNSVKPPIGAWVEQRQGGSEEAQSVYMYMY